jgi:hypothetical protein
MALRAALVMHCEWAQLPAPDHAALRKTTERQIRGRAECGQTVRGFVRRVMDEATRAAQRADGSAVEKLLSRLPQEDSKLGRSALGSSKR